MIQYRNRSEWVNNAFSCQVLDSETLSFKGILDRTCSPVFHSLLDYTTSPIAVFKRISFSQENSFLILVLSEKAASDQPSPLSSHLPRASPHPRLMDSLGVRGKADCRRVVCCISPSMSGQVKSERLTQLSGTLVVGWVWYCLKRWWS